MDLGRALLAPPHQTGDHSMTTARIAGWRLIFLGFAGLAATLWPAPASAQVTDAELGDVESMLTLFPGLRAAAKPAFIAPRVRVTYETGSATFGPDGGGGGGVLQYDVVQVDATQVLAILTSYANDGNGFYPLGGGHVRGYPGLGSFWMNPQALAGAESLSGGGLTVTRTQKTLASGVTHNVMRFQTQTQNGQTVLEFDTQTGVMVFNSISSSQSASQIVLIGMRELALPWAPARAPNWVRPGAALSFAGTQTTTLPGTGSFPVPFEADFQVVQAGPQWSLATSASRLNGQSQGPGAGATGEAQLGGGIWLSRGAIDRDYPPEGLQVDTDPVTGATVFVGRDEAGSVVVQTVTPVSRSTSIYDPRLGVLNRAILEVQSVVSLTTTDISRTTPDGPLDELAAQPPLTGPTGPNGPIGGGTGGGVKTSNGGCGAAPDPQSPWYYLAIAALALATAARRRLSLTAA
jgi:hypothetical protein